MFLIDQLRGLGRQITSTYRSVKRLQESLAFVQEALGRIESRQCASGPAADLKSQEFKVYSQWGEDGIIQFLLRQVPVKRRIFVEFGVQDFTESNTRFLLKHDNWSGLIIDGSQADIDYVKRDSIYWRYNLKAVCAFINRENIDLLLRDHGLVGEIGLLSVDIDGNDYWVWEQITVVNPAIVIVEYNARFGAERAVTIPYAADFQRTKAHHSNIYYGASLAALVALGRRKGYAFVGTNSAGNNAFFVRADLRPESLPELSAAEGFTDSQFREARDARGRLTFASAKEEAAILATCPLVEVPL
ncbi:MAG: dehydrogenase [Chthoniobacteraceae bacterium]|nr:dehydrogenase [Chthoniobacteraceae bacterium]